MSALIAHVKAMRAEAKACRELAESNPSWKPQLLVQAAVKERAADILAVRMLNETTGNEGKAP